MLKRNKAKFVLLTVAARECYHNAVACTCCIQGTTLHSSPFKVCQLLISTPRFIQMPQVDCASSLNPQDIL